MNDFVCPAVFDLDVHYLIIIGFGGESSNSSHVAVFVSLGSANCRIVKIHAAITYSVPASC